MNWLHVWKKLNKEKQTCPDAIKQKDRPTSQNYKHFPRFRTWLTFCGKKKKKDRKLSMSIGSRKISMEALKITIIFIFLIMLV